MFLYQLNDLSLEIILEIKPNNKRTYIKPRFPNIVLITSPKNISIEKQNELVDKFSNYIYKVLTDKNRKGNKEKDTIHLFGEEYKFILEHDIFNHIHIEDKNFICYIKDDNVNIKKIIDEYFYRKTKDFIEYYFEDIKKDMNLNFEISIKYKNVKTFYGECIPKRKEVIFSTKLAKYSPIYIKSVIYHELTHFYYSGHQEDFYSFIEKKFPNYKKIQHEMRMKRYHDIY